MLLLTGEGSRVGIWSLKTRLLWVVGTQQLWKAGYLGKGKPRSQIFAELKSLWQLAAFSSYTPATTAPTLVRSFTGTFFPLGLIGGIERGSSAAWATAVPHKLCPVFPPFVCFTGCVSSNKEKRIVNCAQQKGKRKKHSLSQTMPMDVRTMTTGLSDDPQEMNDARNNNNTIYNLLGAGWLE